ncbi:MAG: DegT/DnrJ/EryC1/StrS family aminotransferase [Bacteroidales bacterium]|nr:DegT/DnrJ/EryC1/StrS family aminotransferase [Bacteroidales bacterium]
MRKIQMVDLQTQYNKIKNEIDAAINSVISSAHFINGESVKEFSDNLAQYLKVKHVIPCANGTDALQIALMSLNLKPSDEIICPDFTFISSAEVIGLLKLHPVLVDVDYNSFTSTLKNIESAITVKTKVIIPVHLFGQAAEMEAITELARKYNLYVIEDTAQALGSDYIFSDGSRKKLGTIGTIGCTSFFPSKNLGCYGDGGALFTDDDMLAERIKMITNHGSRQKYYHQIIGCNSRLDSLQAAILNVKLQYLNQYIESRQQAARYYSEHLKDTEGLIIPQENGYSTHTYHQYTLKVKDGKRDSLKEFLNSRDIPAMIYYPVPLHRQEAFKTIARAHTSLEISEQLSREVLSLPMHTELTQQQQDYIISAIKEFFKQ